MPPRKDAVRRDGVNSVKVTNGDGSNGTGNNKAQWRPLTWPQAAAAAVLLSYCLSWPEAPSWPDSRQQQSRESHPHASEWDREAPTFQAPAAEQDLGARLSCPHGSKIEMQAGWPWRNQSALLMFTERGFLFTSQAVWLVGCVWFFNQPFRCCPIYLMVLWSL